MAKSNTQSTIKVRVSPRLCGPPDPVDFVFTWVNGSNPELQKNYTLYADSKMQQSRFSDLGQLKYALRSVEKYAPWFNHIYLGQFQIESN